MHETSIQVPPRSLNRRNSERPGRIARHAFAKAFAIVATLLMVAISLSPAIEVSAGSPSHGDNSPPMHNAGTETISDSAPPDPNSTDSPGGPSPPPGNVDSVFASTPPFVSTIPGDATRPVLASSDTELTYSTVVGSYSFAATTPYAVRYTTDSGVILVNASTFVVLAPGISLFGEPTILNATDYRYSVRYSFSLGLISSGSVTLTY